MSRFSRSERRGTADRESPLSRHSYRRLPPLPSLSPDGLAFLAEPVEVHYRWRPQLQDPGDEMVLEAAVNGRAHALITFNRRDYGEVPETFGIEVLSPAEVLRRIQG
jgi:hypothetical protein